MTPADSPLYNCSMYKIYLKKGEERRIKKGHPWVYANEVSSIEGKAPNGSLGEVYDFNGNFLGKGYVNRLSKILVRLFIYDIEVSDTEELFSERLIKANALREQLGLGEAYRMVFSESDLLPGLIIDRYADVFVMEILSLGMRLQRDKIVSAASAVSERTSSRRFSEISPPQPFTSAPTPPSSEKKVWKVFRG